MFIFKLKDTSESQVLHSQNHFIKFNYTQIITASNSSSEQKNSEQCTITYSVIISVKTLSCPLLCKNFTIAFQEHKSSIT